MFASEKGGTSGAFPLKCKIHFTVFTTGIVTHKIKRIVLCDGAAEAEQQAKSSRSGCAARRHIAAVCCRCVISLAVVVFKLQKLFTLIFRSNAKCSENRRWIPTESSRRCVWWLRLAETNLRSSAAETVRKEKARQVLKQLRCIYI